MLYREIIAVCSEIHTEHINTAVWANLYVKPSSTQSNHWDLKGHYSSAVCVHLVSHHEQMW